MRRLFYTILAIVVVAQSLQARENVESSDKHGVRIGWGEMALDRSLVWWNEGSTPSSLDVWRTQLDMPTSEADAYLKNVRYKEVRSDVHTSGHIFAEYQYRINQHIGIGGELDYLGVWKDYREFNGYGAYKRSYRDGANLWSIIPKVRFTYVNRPYVRCYSSVGIGMTIRSDFNPHGMGNKRAKSDLSGTFDLVFWGISAGNNNVFGSFELGMTNSFGPETGLTMVLSRLMRFGIGYRF